MRASVPDSATVPDAGDILVFCKVVDLGSMTAAARALGESKATVSRRLARLEARLGAPLLRRDGRSVVPTEDGRGYRERAGAALDLLGEAALAVSAAQASPAGLLRVTAPVGIPGALLLPILPAFLAAHPAVRVEILATDQVLSFRDHEVDVAFRFAESLPDSSLVAHRLDDLQPVLVASPAYARRRGLPADPLELPDFDVFRVPVQATAVMRFRAHAADDTRTVRVPGRLLSHDSLFLLDLARAGAGITMAPRQLVQGELDGGQLVPVLAEWELVTRVRLYLLHAGGVVPPKVRVFRDYVRSALERCPPHR